MKKENLWDSINDDDEYDDDDDINDDDEWDGVDLEDFEDDEVNEILRKLDERGF